MTAAPVVEVQYAVDAGDQPDPGEILRWVSLAVDAAGVSRQVEVSVMIVGKDEMQALNDRFRGRDRPTNVLSFPSDESAAVPGDGPGLLGDIVICAPVVVEEAREQDKSSAAHWAHLLVHGTLHLLGYDHENEADANRMETLETQVLAGQGIADPYRVC